MTSDVIALAIVCKAPVAGQAKTRLSPPLSPEAAASLSRCFIADVAATVQRVSDVDLCRPVAVFTPADAVADFDAVLPPGFVMLAQRGTDLGARLRNATSDLFADGCSALCLINADGPTLPPSLLGAAVAALRQAGNGIVIGPAIDGGYYLLGLRRAHRDVVPALLDGISWSTSQVLTQTLARAASLGLPVTMLPLWYDVDDHAALSLLRQELFGSGSGLATAAHPTSPAPETRRYLLALFGDAETHQFGKEEPDSDTR